MAIARIDKWLWAVRVFKTRTLAAQACRNGKVAINGAPAKASHAVGAGDRVSVRKAPVTYTFEVIEPITQRVGAAKVPEAMRNVTPREQMEILEMARIGRNAIRQRGAGRPTKKERREIEDYMLTAEYSGEYPGDYTDKDDDDGFEFNPAATEE